MIPSDKICGTCGQAMLLKAFRGADVFVCQQCRMVSLSKGDFKTLLQAPATPAPAETRRRAVPPPQVDEVEEVEEVEVVEERARPHRISGPERPAPVSTGPSIPPGREAPQNSMDLGDTTSALSPNDGPALDLGYDGTEETEEFEQGPRVGTMAKTEIAGPDDDAVYDGRADEQAAIDQAFQPVEPGLPFDDGHAIQDLSAPAQGEALDDDFEAELAAYQARRRRSIVLAGVAFTAVLLVVVVLGVGAGMAGLFAATDGSDEPTPAGPTEPQPSDAPAPADPSEPEPAEAPEPTAPSEPEPAEAPEPAEPEPEPAPAPAPSGGSKVRSLVEQGWNSFDSDPELARGRFEAALAIDPNHADANYGYGYALLKQGQATASVPYLCRAQRTGDAESARDIRALLSQNGLSCEGL